MYAVLAIALSGWIAWATQAIEEYYPLSWLVVFILIVSTLLLFVIVIGLALNWESNRKDKLFRQSIDDKLAEKGLKFNPLESEFIKHRIYIEQLALPSYPFIVDKKFTDCEIIGPANIYLVGGTAATGVVSSPRMDAVYIPKGATFNNGFVFSACQFRGCSFHNITIFVDHESYDLNKEIGGELVNWISLEPENCEGAELKHLQRTDSEEML